MRAYPAALLLLAFASLKAVKVGDPEYLVTRELGQPPAVLQISEKKKILTYDRGDVTIESGRVTRVNLISKSDHEAAKMRGDAEKRLAEERIQRETALKAQESELAAKAEAEQRQRQQIKKDRFGLLFTPATSDESGPFKVRSLNISLAYPRNTHSSIQSIGGGVAGATFEAPPPIGCHIRVEIVNNTDKPLDSSLVSIQFKQDNGEDSLGASMEPAGAVILPGTSAHFGLTIAFGKPPAGHPRMMSFDHCLISLFSGTNKVPLTNSLWIASGSGKSKDPKPQATTNNER